MNTKFATGTEQFVSAWPGPVDCLLPLRPAPDAFSAAVDPANLPFGLRHRAPDHRIDAADLDGADVILASGDIHEYLHLVPLAHALGQKLVYTIELNPQIRRQIVMLDPNRTRFQKAKTLVWLERNEIYRKRAVRLADGLQTNGYPAFGSYAPLSKSALFYLDNRISSDLLVTDTEMAAREASLLSGAPLQIIHSGRLETLKGSQGLIDIARDLVGRGVSFDLHIFGSGSLETPLQDQARAEGLSQVHFHGAVDFATELVPFCRQKGDLFLSLHLQSDPSCTYLESFGSGLPILGYDNRMWSEVNGASDAGWVVPKRDLGAIVKKLAELDGARDQICAARSRARGFAAERLFETEFNRRMDHLKTICGLPL